MARRAVTNEVGFTRESAGALSAHRCEEECTRFLPVLPALQKGSGGILTNIEYILGRIECDHHGWLGVRGGGAKDRCIPEH